MPRILLVEDNEHNWDMLSRRLRRRGYEVDIAVNGQEGVDMAVDLIPDLILMDINLPIFDGLEATRRIRRTGATANIPVIALTAHALSSDREDAINAGCNDYHAKPVELTRLLEQMERLIDD